MTIKKISLVLVTGLAAFFLGSLYWTEPPAAAASPSGSSKTTGSYMDGEILLVIEDPLQMESVLNRYNLTSPQKLLVNKYYKVKIPVNNNPNELSKLINQQSTGVYAEPNYVFGFGEKSSNYGFDSSNYGFDSGSIIKGTMLSNPEAIKKAKNQAAWKEIQLSAAAAKGYTGRGVTVAVLDTGVNYNHPELKGKVLTGYDTFNGGDGMDVQGHGTFIAGIIEQIAPDALILPVRVLDNTGHGTLEAVLNGLQYASDKGAKVINMSFSTVIPHETLMKELQQIARTGAVLVGAVGNENSSIVNYPAGSPKVLAVASADSSGQKASFSNYGKYVSLSAPGTGIYSMGWKGGYGTSDGTSFSTSIASGAAALELSLHPEYASMLINKRIIEAVDPYPASCGICKVLGSGILDLALLN